MPSAPSFLTHPDALTREVARQYAAGGFLMDNGDGVQFYTVSSRAIVPLTEEEGLHISRRLRRELKHFEPRVDTAFAQVIEGCRGLLPGSPARDGEWISDELTEIYVHLYSTGLAHSFEVWRDGELAGGVLGIALGGVFFAESKFHRVTNASKAALVYLARYLSQNAFSLLDAQIQNDHIAKLGVVEIEAGEFQRRLGSALFLDVELTPK